MKRKIMSKIKATSLWCEFIMPCHFNIFISKQGMHFRESNVNSMKKYTVTVLWEIKTETWNTEPYFKEQILYYQ